MSVYIVARIDIEDREGYGRYEAGFMEIFAAHGGRLLAVDETPEILEGAWPVTRTVLIEFPDREAAMAWYRSEDYQHLARHRFAASTGDIAMLKSLT
ncbi:MAG: DUF1330 domain-containing protein [Pseudomonadales bacterium]|jgi:uncharacterized protein (DUF1330 family)|nr:DUF1330 domain-containing protein [Pseudomonadales bacterium]